MLRGFIIRCIQIFLEIHSIHTTYYIIITGYTATVVVVDGVVHVLCMYGHHI